MKKQAPQPLKVRTALQAGTSCSAWDTNCKGKDKHGNVVWDNCHDGQAFAGLSCEAAIKANGGGYCYEC
jgi:hypothetical protein